MTKFTKGLVAVSLVLLFAASYLLNFQRNFWDAALLLLLAVGGLLIAFVNAFSFSADFSAHFSTLLPQRPSGWVRLGALLLSALVALSTRGSADPTMDYSFLTLLWLLALGAFALTLIIPLFRAGILCHFTMPVWEARALAALLLCAALLRFVALGRVPATLGGDEGTQLLAGLGLLERPLGNPFATGWFSVPTMSFFAYGLGMRVFGTSVAGGRAISAIVGTLTVLSTFFLGRALGGRRVGWVAALVTTFSAYHIHYSRLASNQIFDPFIATLALGLLWVALNPERLKAAGLEINPLCFWAFLGIVAGFGWYLYFGARWVSFLVALIVAWRLLMDSSFLHKHWQGLLIFLCACLLVTLPLLGWYSVHPADLSARYNQVSIFASGWLGREVELTGKSVPQILLEQFGKSVGAFNFVHDPTFWYYPEMPLFDFVSAALLVLGMLVALLRWRWPARGMTLIWFWSTLLMAWTLTENPPSSQRGLLLVPAVALCVAWGIDALFLVFGRYKEFLYAFLSMLLVMVSVLNVGFYFGVYTPRRAYGNPTAVVATEIARFVLATPLVGCEPPSPTCGTIYFHGPPVLYWDFGGFAFLLRDYQGVDVLPDDVLSDLTLPSRFVFVADRVDDLDAIKVSYPGGTLFYVNDRAKQPLAIIYDWGGAQTP